MSTPIERVIVTVGSANSSFPTDFENLQHNDIVKYDISKGRWVNDTLGTVIGAPVDSVNGQTGVVVLDYSDVGAAPTAHNHAISDITNLQTELDGKSDINHTHIKADITDFVEADYEPAITKNTAFNKNFGVIADSVCEGNDSRLSDARTPTAHNHAISDITNLQTELDGKSDTNHTHTKSQITDFVEADYATAAQGTLADSALQDITNESISDLSDVVLTSPENGQSLVFNGTNWVNQVVSSGGGDVLSVNGQTGVVVLDYSDVGAAPTAHNHAISDITNLQTELDGKSDINHTHIKADITDFVEADYEPAITKNTAFNKNFGVIADSVCEGNDSRLSDSRNPTAHNHAISDITNLATELDGKSDINHTHTKSQITDFVEADYEPAITKNTAFNKNFGSVSDSVCEGDDSRLSDARTPTAHNHAISDVTGLQTELDGKSDINHTHTKSQITDFVEADYEPAITKNTAFNKNFGVIADSVCEGNDSRLSDARTPTAHNHAISDITNLATELDGKSDTNHTHIKADITDFIEADYATAAQGTKADSALQDITNEYISDLFDVVLTTPENGQSLVFNGTNWINQVVSSGVAWGDITGTLANQTDLNSALGLKANSADVYAKTETYNKTEIDDMVGDIEATLDAILGV